MISKYRLEKDLVQKTKELIKLYRQYNPNGNYLHISFLQTKADSGRVHINNAFYDRDHMHPIDIKEDISL